MSMVQAKIANSQTTVFINPMNIRYVEGQANKTDSCIVRFDAQHSIVVAGDAQTLAEKIGAASK